MAGDSGTTRDAIPAGLSDPLCGRCDYGPLHGQQLPCSTDPDCPCFNDDPEEYRLYVGGEW